jgi:hypothetical protein
MKKNVGKYPDYEKLPKNAKLVADYAKDNNITTSLIYKQFKKGKGNFKIITFRTINFIIP